MRILTKDDVDRGFYVCGCGKYAYVTSSAVLDKLPKDYYGHFCDECRLIMYSVDELREAGFNIPEGEAQ